MKTTDRPIVLSIAGFDPSGGAGILADVKTFEQLKVNGMSVMTANTMQTEDHFYDLHWNAATTICQSINILMQQYPIHIVKIGIVADAKMLQQIITCIRQHRKAAFIIWDPVIRSSTGKIFLKNIDDPALLECLQTIDLITPNLPEYQLLKPYISKAKAVLLKGGHSKDNPGLDLLYLSNELISFQPNITGAYPKHGSGCVLSAAIAAYMARDYNITDACKAAKTYVEQFLNSHPGLLGYHNHAE